MQLAFLARSPRRGEVRAPDELERARSRLAAPSVPPVPRRRRSNRQQPCGEAARASADVLDSVATYVLRARASTTAKICAVLCCALPCSAAPTSVVQMIWRFAPDHVVIKPVFGFNQHGVLLLDHGVDRITGSKIAGRKDVVAYHRRSGLLGPATRKEGAVLNSTRISLGQAVQMRGKVMAEQLLTSAPDPSGIYNASISVAEFHFHGVCTRADELGSRAVGHEPSHFPGSPCPPLPPLPPAETLRMAGHRKD